VRTLKPMTLTALNAPFQHEGKVRLVLVVGAMVSLDGTVIEQEQTLWYELGRLPGSSGALDEIKPKVRGEALLSGFAFAPQGKPAPIVAARFTVGPIDKEVWAIGDRTWKLTGPTEPVPFTEMPLGYDRAFGGEGFAPNPIGKGYAPVKDAAGNAVHPLPNVELAKKLITSPRERPPVAGFGPVDPSLPQRMKKLGTYDKKWLDTRYPEMAEDFDPTYFNVAPEDQWIDGYWQGGEPFSLTNLHRDKPKIEGTLPSFKARCFVTRKGAEEGALDDVALRCDTVWFVPHLERVILLFRGGVDVADEDASDIVDMMVALERPGEPRSLDHYRNVRALRTNKSQGGLFALRETDLIPADLKIERSAALRDMDELMAREDLVRANMRRRAERELGATRERLAAAGVDPDTLLPKEIPADPKTPELHEVPELVDRMKAEAEKHREEATARLREACQRVGMSYDDVVANSKEGAGGPPKFSAEEQIAHIRKLIDTAKQFGVPVPEGAARVEDPAFVEALRKAETAIRDAYRRAAHHMPPARAMSAEEAAAARKQIEAALAAKESLAGRDLTGADLAGLDFSERDLTGTLLEKAKLAGASFRGAKVDNAVFTRADLTGADFHGASAKGANFGEADLTRAKLTGAIDLTEAIFLRAVLTEADLTGARLDSAQLSEVKCDRTILAGIRGASLVVLKGDLRNVDLRGARIEKAVFHEVDLSGSDLSEATFFRTSLVDTTIEDARLRKVKLERVSLSRVEKGSSLARSDLRGADLRRINLRGVNLEGADLREADLTSADFSDANLRGAKLEAARAVEGRFMKADLTDADVSRADLMHALLGGAIVRGASFEEANLFRADGAKMKGDDKTSFKGANVKQVRVVPDRSGHG
jgi:uncharacterized protein YjbI with pentapeptide repeats